VKTADKSVIKFWLLTAAVEFPRDLGLIFPVVHGLALNLKEVPNCEPQDYARCLVELFDSELITFESGNAEYDVSSREGVSRAVDRIARQVENKEHLEELRVALRRGGGRPVRQNIRFRLTQVGGSE